MRRRHPVLLNIRREESIHLTALSLIFLSRGKRILAHGNLAVPRPLSATSYASSGVRGLLIKPSQYSTSRVMNRCGPFEQASCRKDCRFRLFFQPTVPEEGASVVHRRQ